MLPYKPDKKTVYAYSLKTVENLLNSGIEIYLYNGFIHSKVLMTEDVLSVGSCNFDYRSFELNFELTALIYGNKHINKHKQQVLQDLKSSTLITTKIYKRLTKKYRIWNLIYHILKKIL